MQNPNKPNQGLTNIATASFVGIFMFFWQICTNLLNNLLGRGNANEAITAPLTIEIPQEEKKEDEDSSEEEKEEEHADEEQNPLSASVFNDEPAANTNTDDSQNTDTAAAPQQEQEELSIVGETAQADAAN